MHGQIIVGNAMRTVCNSEKGVVMSPLSDTQKGCPLSSQRDA
jgi:hypothetical protein